MTSAVHRAAGFQVPSASQSENARLVFCTLGAPWINASKNTWGCSFASCNKKQHMQPMYPKKNLKLGDIHLHLTSSTSGFQCISSKFRCQQRGGQMDIPLESG